MSKILITRGKKYIEIDQEELKLPYDELQVLIEHEFQCNAKLVIDKKSVNKDCHEILRGQE